ncbi:MAG TPA: hypothetical protein DF774_08465 [Rheinheimera sp.]|uniref:hypothetical protein n=1 Tax=Rheinheimera sp. TaxID=1869214 RepID=UPI000ED6D455|nr:hypothetical protein [Rheinheimera sp.]HCU65778.1 hypothetical protein [Rheinheimera sp.]
MVAVVSGAGLGLFHSNLSSGIESLGHSEIGQAKERVYVNAATGNLVVQNSDEKISGLGLGFSMLRTYNSQAVVDGDNNDQWRLGYISTISFDGLQYQRVAADGFTQTFSHVSGNTYQSFEGGGHADTLKVIASNHVEITSDGGVTEVYIEGKLIERRDPVGVVQIYYSNGQPEKIIQNLQNGTDETHIEYYQAGHTSAGLIKSIRTSNLNNEQKRVEYRYDSSQRLQYVLIDKTPENKTDNNIYVIEYGYKDQNSKLLTSIKQYDYQHLGSTSDNKIELNIEYYSETEATHIRGRVKSVTQGLLKTTYIYVDSNKTRVTTASDSIDYEFDAQERLKSVSFDSSAGTRVTTSYSYNAKGLLETVTAGTNESTTYSYDENGNITKILTNTGADVIRQYNAQNNLILERIGRENSGGEFYDRTVSRYVYDNSGQFLRFILDGNGGVTEYRYNMLNQRIEERKYTKEAFDLASYTAEQVPTLQTLESWVSKVSDKSAQELLTFSYDLRGNLHTKTAYSQLDTKGDGAGPASVWSYIYDFRGQLLQETRPEGNLTVDNPYDHVTTFAYDGLGRAVSKTDGERNTVSFVFDDKNRSFEVRYQNGLVERSTYDKSGLIVSLQSEALLDSKDLGSEFFVYDDAGRLSASKDVYGQWEYRFYEASGALAATVGKNGNVTRYYYDAAGRLEKTVQLDALVTPSSAWVVNNKLEYSLAQLDSFIKASPTEKNRISWSFYENGKKVLDVDAEIFLTRYIYDYSDTLIGYVKYELGADLVRYDENERQRLVEIERQHLGSSRDDIASWWNEFDSAGRISASLNTDSFLKGSKVEYFYDKVGRKIAETAYAEQITEANQFQVAPDEVNDRTKQWRYDAQGRVVATVSADGHVERFEYNLNGQLVKHLSYATLVRGIKKDEPISIPAGAVRVTSYQYDGNDRLVRELSPEGLLTEYHYNNMGLLVEKRQGAKVATASQGVMTVDTSAEHKIERFGYDLKGQLTAQLDTKSNQELGLNVTAAQVQQALSGNPSVAHIYNHLGQLIESRDAEGYATLYFYNKANQLAIIIDPEKQLTHLSYNAFGDLVSKYSAAKPIPQTQYEQLIQARKTNADVGLAEATGLIATILKSYIDPGVAPQLSNKDDADVVETFSHDKLGNVTEFWRDLVMKSSGNQFGQVQQKWNWLGLQTHHITNESFVSLNSAWSSQTKSIAYESKYDIRGLLVEQKRDGEIISTQAYDAFGRLTKITGAKEQQTTTNYGLDVENDKVGRVVTTSQLVNGNTVQKTITRYDAFDRVLEVIDPLGNKTSYHYDDVNRKTTVTSTLNGKTVVTETSRNVLGRVTDVVVKQDNIELQSSRYVYDANGNLKEVYLNNKLQESRTYTKNNRLEFVTDATDIVKDKIGSRVKSEYDKNGKVIKTITDFDGLAITTEWKQEGNRSVVKQTQGDKVSWITYDKNGRVSTEDLLEVSANGNRYKVRTSYKYDQAGQKLEVSSGLRISIDANNNEIKDSNGQTITDSSAVQTTGFNYDSYNRLSRQYKLNGTEKVNEVQYLYDESDRLIERIEIMSSDSVKRTFYGYDNGDMLVFEAVTHSMAGNSMSLSVRTFDYDNKGQRIAQHQFMSLLDSGVALNGQVNPATLQTQVAAYTGKKASTYFGYDNNGRQNVTVDANGTRSFSRFDALGRLMEEFTLTTQTVVSSTEADTLKQTGTLHLPAAGQYDARTRYIYNDQNKVAFKLVSTGTEAMLTGYEYDLEGKLIQTRQYATKVSYDANLAAHEYLKLQKPLADRVTQLFYDNADRLRFSIDAGGLVTEMRYNLQGQVTQELKHIELINAETSYSQEWQNGTLEYASLVAKYADSILLPGTRVITNEYDSLGRLTKITYPEKNPTTKLYYTELFSYNAAGLKTSFTDRNGNEWRYQYDAAGRLEAEYTPELGAEQLLQNLKEGVNLTDASVNPYESVKGFGKKLYQYDSAGNLISITQGLVLSVQSSAFYGQTRVTKFGYDLAGRQIQVVQPKATNAPETLLTQTFYNAQGLATVSATFADGVLRAAFFKVYDAAGQLQYDVEATDTDGYKPLSGQVSSYEYNSFGQMTKLTRYAQEIVLGNWDSLTPEGLAAKVDANHVLNRSIYTEYDSAGRKIKVFEQSREYSYFSTAQNAYVKANRQPVTEYHYNSFGELFKTSVATGQGVETLDSYNWYDNLGRKIVTLDPAGYMSGWTYNGTGEVETYTEYARAVQGTLNAEQPPAAPVPGDENSGANRTWRYQYDALGRQISETQLFIRASANNAQAIVNQTQKTQVYDGTGHVVSATNSDGTIAFEYDAIGNLIQQTGPLSQTSLAIEQLNPYLNLSQTSSNQQRVTRYSYDIFGNQTEQRVRSTSAQDDNTQDLVSRVVYNSRGQAIVQTELVSGKDSKVTEMFYNEQGRVIESRQIFKEPSINTRLLTRIHAVTTIAQTGKITPIDNLGSLLTFDFATGRVKGQLPAYLPAVDFIKVEFIDENGVTQTYNAEQKPIINGVVDHLVVGYTPAAVSTVTRTFSNRYKYDTQGRVVETYVVGATENSGVKETKLEHTERYVYNSFGEVAFKYLLDSAGVEQLAATYVYNSSGQMIRNDEQATPTTLQYDLAGRLVQTTNPISGKNYYQLDKAGRQQTVYLQGTENTPFVTRQTFDRWGNVVSLTDARGYLYRYQYNHQNKVTAEFKPKVTVVEDNGNQDSKVTKTSFIYDQQGRVLQATDANGNSKKYQYDAYGQLLVEIDAMGAQTYFGYDIFGRKVAQQDALGLIQFSRYNQLGLVTETGQLYKHTSGVQLDRILEIQNQYEYNAAGQRIVSKDGTGHVFYYRYDARNHLIMSMSPSLVRKEYQYDSQGNKTEESFARQGAKGLLSASWQFDAWGRQTQHSDLGGVNSTVKYREYNLTDSSGQVVGTRASNQVERITDGHGKDIQYHYYNNGWLKSVIDHTNGSSSEYKYNANGQRIWELHKAKDNNNLAVVQLVETSYDEQGRVSKVQVWDGENPAYSQLLSKISYRYDAVGNRRSLRVANSFDGLIQVAEIAATPNSIVVPIRSGSEFKSLPINGDSLFISDEPEMFQFSLASGAPEWLELVYQPNSETFMLQNKLGQKSPPFNNYQTLSVTINAQSVTDASVVATKTLTIKLMQPTTVLSPALTEETDFINGHSKVYPELNLIERHYKAAAYDASDSDKVRFSFVSIALLEREQFSTNVRTVKDYFLDPNGGEVSIDINALKETLKQFPFLSLDESPTGLANMRIKSDRAIDHPDRVVLQSGTFNIPIVVIDSQGMRNTFTLRLKIDPMPPSPPKLPEQPSVIFLGEGNVVNSQLTSIAESGKAVTYQISSGVLPPGLKLSADGRISGTIDSKAVTGTGDHWNSIIIETEIVAIAGGLASAPTKFTFDIRNTPTSWSSQKKELPVIKALINRPVVIQLADFLRAPDGNRVKLKSVPQGMVYDDATFSLRFTPTALTKYEFSLELEDGRNGSGHSINPQPLIIDAVEHVPVLATDLSLESDYFKGQSKFDAATNTITRQYKATVYDPLDADKTRYSFVSIALQNRSQLSTPDRVVRDYFIDPYGGQITIDVDRLKSTLDRPEFKIDGKSFLSVVVDEVDQSKVSIRSILGSMANGQVVLKSGIYTIPVVLKDSKGDAHTINLVLDIAPGKPGAPTLPGTSGIVHLGEGNIVNSKLVAAVESGKAVKFQIQSGTLPPGITLSENGEFTGTVSSNAVIGEGNHWNTKDYQIVVVATSAEGTSPPTTLNFQVRNTPTAWKDVPALRPGTAKVGQSWTIDLSKYLKAPDGNMVQFMQPLPAGMVHDTVNQKLVWVPSALEGGKIVSYELRINDSPNSDGTNGHPPQVIKGSITVEALEVIKPPQFKLPVLPTSISEQQQLSFNVEIIDGRPPFSKPIVEGRGVGLVTATSNPRIWSVLWTPDPLTGSGNHWNTETQTFTLNTSDLDGRAVIHPISTLVRNVPTPWVAPTLTPLQTIVGYGGVNAGNAFTYKLPADFLKAPDGNYAVSSVNSTTGRIDIISKPDWVNWDPATRTLTGTPPPAHLRSVDDISFRVYDGYHGPHVAKLSIKLNVVSVTATAANFNLQAGASVYENIPSKIKLQKSYPAGVSHSGYGLLLNFKTKSGSVINYESAGLFFDGTTGVLSGTLRNDVTSVSQLAFDVYYAFNNLGYGSYFSTETVKVSVTPAATPPGIGANWNSSTVIGEGQWAENFSQLSFSATDSNAGVLEFSAVSALPAGLSLRSDGKLIGQVSSAAVTGSGDHWNEKSISFTVQVKNKSTGQVTSGTYSLRVTNTPTPWVNGNKTLPDIYGRQYLDMNPVSLSNFVKAPDGNSVTITNVSGLPAGVYWDPSTLSIYGMPEVYRTGSAFVYSVTIYDKWHGSKTLQGNMYVSKGSGVQPYSVSTPLKSSTQNLELSQNQTKSKPVKLATGKDRLATYSDSSELAMRYSSTSSVQLDSDYPDEPPAPVYAESKTYWYSYDQNNRVLVDGGSLVDGKITISQQGSQIFYNAVGQQEYLLTSKGHEAQKFVYNAKNQLDTVMRYYGSIQNFSLQPGLLKDSKTDWRNLVAYQYDGVGRVIKTKNYWQNLEFTTVSVPGSGGEQPLVNGINSNNQLIEVTLDFRGALSAMQTTEYTADGEVKTVEEKSWGHSYVFDTKDRLGLTTGEGLVETYYRVDGFYENEDILTTQVSKTLNKNFNVAGLAEEFTYTRFKVKSTDIETTNTYNRLFDKRDTLIEREVKGRGTVVGDGKIMPGSTYSLYDSNGNRVLVQEENLLDTSKITTRQMVYAADGTLLKKNDGTASSLSTIVNNKVQYATITAGGTAHHFSSNGNYLGEIAQDKAGRISSSLKDQHFSGATQNDSSNVIQYQVQSGDSLKSLALNFYGNADYWYLIANLNGLTSSPDEALSAGLSIDIPARASSSNSANSFKPMDLQKIIGDTTPSLPYVPPPPAAGCNAVAMIVMIAITVVATIATAGAAAAAMTGQAFSMSLGASAMMGGAAVGGVALGAATATTAAMSAGMIAATAAAASAVGGFAGSVAGQLAGKAMGVVDSFSLKNAFASGITAGATAGMGNYLQGTKLVTDAGKLGAMGKMAMAASGAGINVAANKLAGNNKASFQWRNVVTGAATAGALDHLQLNNITDPLERFTNSGGFVTDLIHGVAGAAVGYGVSKGLYNEGSWNFRNVATDVFGNALGNSIVAGLSAKSGPSAENGKLSAKEQAELDQKMAAMDRTVQNRMAGKTEDGATYTSDGVRTYGTTAKVDSSGNVTDLSGNFHINAKELRNVINNEQWDTLGSVMSLRGDDELAFGGDAILGRDKAGFLRSELNIYADEAHGRIKLANAAGNLSLTGITSSLTGALRAVSRGVSDNVVPAAREVLRKHQLASTAPKGRLDYSSTFRDDLVNFNSGYQHFSGKAESDMFLVQFHRSDRELGKGRSAAWWTTPDQANVFKSIDDVRQNLALPPNWGPRDAVSIAKIPKGAEVEYYLGTAARQKGGSATYEGNGLQFRFKNFDPTWIIDTRVIPGVRHD